MRHVRKHSSAYNIMFRSIGNIRVRRRLGWVGGEVERSRLAARHAHLEIYTGLKC